MLEHGCGTILIQLVEISFLPFSEHTYRQAPYQDCTKQEYDELFAKIPQEVDWSKIV